MSHGFNGCYTVFPCVTRCYMMLQCHMVLDGLKECHTVEHPFLTQSYSVLQTFTGCYAVVHVVTQCYMVLQGVTCC